MKKLSTLFIFLFILIVAVKAQTSSATIFSQDGEKFWLIIDGIRQNDKPEANVKVTGLPNPNYRMKVIFDDERIPSIDQNLYLRSMDDKPVDLSYVIRKNNKGKMVMRGNSWEEAKAAPVPTKDQSVITFHTTENPKTTATEVTAPVVTQTVTTKTTTTNTPITTNQTETINTGINVNIGANGINMNVTVPDSEESINMGVNTNITGTGTGTSTTTTTTRTTTTTSSSGTAPVQKQEVQKTAPVAAAPVAEPATKKCTTAMSPGDFSDAKASIEKQSFSETKMKTAQQITKNNCLSTAQVKEILSLFSFEADRLNFAKYAYDFTTDKGKYFMVNDVFSFSSSVNELNKYLEDK
jgi:hypothetical protein